jgi:ribosomal protein S18 acetylase RimI-like enzyme
VTLSHSNFIKQRIEGWEEDKYSLYLALKGMRLTLPFEIKFLDGGSLDELLELQNFIAANLSCPEVFILHDEEYFREVLRLKHSAIGVMFGETLIAFSIIRIPGISAENLGRDIGLLEEELTRLAHLQAAAVHPAYRGHGLQRKLTLAHLDVIEEMGFEHACCTVSPKNPVSLGNYLSCGLVIEGLRPKKHGWWRFILHKNIMQVNQLANGYNPGTEIEQKRIAISDIAGQLELLSKGFKGFRILHQCEGDQVFYTQY